MAGAGLIFDLAKVGYGLYQGVEADKAYSNLPDRQKYKDAESILTEANSGAKGFSALEKAVAFQNKYRADNAKYQKALSYRPDLANAIQAGINFGGIQENNNLAVADAQLKRQDEQRRAGLIQSQDIAQVGSFNENLRQREVALGQAGQAAAQNVFGGIGDAANRIEQQNYYDRLDKLYAQPTYGQTSATSPVYSASATNLNYGGAPNMSAQNTPITNYGQSFNPYQQQPYYQPSYLSPNQPAYTPQTTDYTKSFYNY